MRAAVGKWTRRGATMALTAIACAILPVSSARARNAYVTSDTDPARSR